MPCAKCRKPIKKGEKFLVLGWSLNGRTWHAHYRSFWHRRHIPLSLLKLLGLKPPKKVTHE